MKQFLAQDFGDPVSNWTPRLRPTKMQLKGRYCYIEPLDMDRHGLELFNAFKENGEDSWAYLPYGPYLTFIEFQQGMQKIAQDLDTLLYAILENNTHSPIGIAGYLRINPDHGSIEIGHLHYTRRLQKTPAATEAMYLLMRYVFEDLGYRRYEWKCNSLNLPSCKAAERLGFTFEGIFRQANVVKGYNRDTAWFSILDHEWPLIKARLEKWLDPKNFAVTGEQILKLQEIKT